MQMALKAAKEGDGAMLIFTEVSQLSICGLQAHALQQAEEHLLFFDLTVLPSGFPTTG